MIATVPSYTYTNEKHILKFYIRLLLYLEHEDSKNEDLKHDIGHENYLTFVGNALDQMFVELLGREIPDKTEAEPLEAQANLLEAQGLEGEALGAQALGAQALGAQGLEGEALGTDSAQEKGQYFDFPFSKSTSDIIRTRPFGKDEDKMINIIKTNLKFINIYDLLSRNTFAAQELFIKDAFKEFPKSKWTEDTVFTDEDVNKILTTAQRAIDKIKATTKT